MRAGQIQRVWLQARLMLARVQPGIAVAAGLCLGGAIAWSWWVPHQKAEAARARAGLQHAITAAQRAADTTGHAAPLSSQARASAFYAVLGERRRAEQPLETLFALANANGLALAKGEYKGSYNNASRVYSYQAQLPVTGSYAAIRRFCETALRALPYASLDEISFRREVVGNGMLEARLRFTLHLGETPAGRAATEPGEAAPAAAKVIALREMQP